MILIGRIDQTMLIVRRSMSIHNRRSYPFHGISLIIYFCFQDIREDMTYIHRQIYLEDIYLVKSIYIITYLFYRKLIKPKSLSRLKSQVICSSLNLKCVGISKAVEDVYLLFRIRCQLPPLCLSRLNLSTGLSL